MTDELSAVKVSFHESKKMLIEVRSKMLLYK